MLGIPITKVLIDQLKKITKGKAKRYHQDYIHAEIRKKPNNKSKPM